MTQPLKNSALTTATTKSLAKLHYRLDCLSSKLTHDQIIIEEPLQINLLWFNTKQNNYQQDELAVIMRTPGNDTELVVGFLFAEAVIKHKNDILNIVIDHENENLIEVELNKNVSIDWHNLARNFTSQSSCGLCGKTSIKSLALKCQRIINTEKNWLAIGNIPLLMNKLAEQQPLFSQTGGVHGAALINNEQWLSIKEDIGRHNAVDKVIGEIILADHSIEQGVLLLTGRISFELMQKAAMAAIPVVIAVGAPSSLAISVAKQFDITLIGFSKVQQFNVYHGDWRLRSEI